MICEPPAAHSPQCSYQFTKAVYANTSNLTYTILTLLFGGPLSFIYGLSCGVISFFLISCLASHTICSSLVHFIRAGGKTLDVYCEELLQSVVRVIWKIFLQRQYYLSQWYYSKRVTWTLLVSCYFLRCS